MTPANDNLARHARRASFWSGSDSVLRALLGFAVTVALARLIAPDQFGVIAMILVFSAIANVLIDAGLGTALIQRQDADHVDESTAFFFNLGMSVVLALLLALSAPWIARFFGQPMLTGIARLMAVNLVVSALGTIHTTLLAKELNFRPQLFIGLWSLLLSGALAIYLAWRGYGAWALAWQVLAQTSITTILLWTWHCWRPLAIFDRVALSGLLKFGGRVMAASLIDTLYARLYSVFIGKLFGASELGFYTRAQSTQQLPTSLLTNILNRVALPTFAKTAHAPAALVQTMRTASRLLMFMNLPLMTGMAVTAHPLIEILFGSRWLPAAPLLQVLCIAGALWPLQMLNVSVLLAQGESRKMLRIEVIKKLFGIVVLIATAPFGLMSIVWGQVVAAMFAFAANSFYTGRLLKFGATRQVRSLDKILAATLVMLVTLLAVKMLLPKSPELQLSVLAPLGVITYLIACKMIGVSQMREITQQIIGRFTWLQEKL